MIRSVKEMSYEEMLNAISGFYLDPEKAYELLNKRLMLVKHQLINDRGKPNGLLLDFYERESKAYSKSLEDGKRRRVSVLVTVLRENPPTQTSATMG